VVDDIDLKITHVVRGEDHVTNSGAQIEIFRALGGEPPTFAHTPLLVGADGDKLSKRLGSLSLGEFRDRGIEPMAVCSLMAKLGTSDPVEARSDLATLADEFDFAKIGRAPARFDEADVVRLNAALLHAMPFEAVSERLGGLGIGGGEAFWNAVRANVETVADAKAWWDVVEGPVTPVIEDADFASKAAALVPDGELNADSWSPFVAAVKEATGTKGKALYMPLRQALTGQSHGPEMGSLFALIGAEKAKARLSGKSA